MATLVVAGTLLTPLDLSTDTRNIGLESKPKTVVTTKANSISDKVKMGASVSGTQSFVNGKYGIDDWNTWD